MALPARFANRYELGRLIGWGGFGDVWLAWDHHRNMQVALKLFRQPIPMLAYYEAQLLTALEGDHVLKVNNADTFVDTPYLATAVAAGGTAEDQLPGSPFGFPADVAIRWTRHLLVGLGSCHGRRLAHRDIKPSNLFLSAPDHGLIGDFGVAAVLDAADTVSKAGTPETMAPEMIRDGRGTLSSDVYSVGVTLYRLLTGRWAFQGLSPAETEALVLAGVYAPLRDVAPHISRRLADRVKAAMSPDFAKRPATANEFHDALGAPDLMARAWQRIAPHPGHDRCWQEVRTGAGASHEVCVNVAGTGFAIEVRRATGSRSRVLTYCRTANDERQLLVRLRDTFDHL